MNRVLGGQRNWWKISFFVLLIAFEISREAAVLLVNTEPRVAARANFSSYGTRTTASGQWRRMDGVRNYMVASTTIYCRKDMGVCVEATATMVRGNPGEKNIAAPDVRFLVATFTPEAIHYENDTWCDHVRVRLDLKMKKVFAVLKPDKSGPSECGSGEQTVALTLGDGNVYQRDPEPFGDHFVPIFRVIAALF